MKRGVNVIVRGKVRRKLKETDEDLLIIPEEEIATKEVKVILDVRGKGIFVCGKEHRETKIYPCDEANTEKRELKGIQLTLLGVFFGNQGWKPWLP